VFINHRYVSVKVSESELRERNRALSVLLDISNFLSGFLRPGEVLDGALLKVLEHFRLDAGRVYLMDESGEALTLAAHRGIEATGLERVQLNEGFTGKAARTRSLILQHVSDLEDRERAALLASKGLRIVICAPLIAMDEVVGVMNLASARVIQLDQADIDLLIVIGNLVAVSLHNARLHENLEAKIKEVEEKGDTIKFFAYSGLHDLKSPAIGILGLTKLLKRHYCHLLDQRGRQYCEQIVKASGHLAALVERINAYIAAKEAPLTIEEVPVAEVLEMIRGEFAEILKERGVRWWEAENLPRIMADRLSLVRVFRNLVDNALKYGGPDLQEIRIDHREDAAHHVFAVSDDGVGIHKGQAERLFQVFERHETSRGTEGAGLGLAIIKVIAERHHGWVRMETGGARGVTFHVAIAKGLH
jgi:K+-sensing histidine kinase KdpD